MWRERHERLLLLRDSGAFLDTDSPDDLGALVDKAEDVLKGDNLPGLQQSVLSEFVELALRPEQDFKHYCSLETSLHSKVDIVHCPAQGPGRVYVQKAVTKDHAVRMHGQCSPFLERDILVAARDLRPSDCVPKLLTALHDEDYLYLVIEYLPSGNVLDMLEKQPNQRLPEEMARFWIAELIEGLQWTHDCGYAHRDVKPGNLLLTADGHVKLTDFGSSAPFDFRKGSGPYQIDPGFCLTPVGTVDYIAPEILLAHQAALDANDSEVDVDTLDAETTYGPEVDWWSVGATFYETVYGSAPFYAATIPETYELIVRSEEFLSFPDRPGLSADAVELMKALLSPAELRLGRFFGAKEIRQHFYFEDVDFGTLRKGQSPFVPAQRPPPPPSRQSYLEPASQASDFFSSPGISILRSTTPIVESNAWTGFTYLPPADAFDRATVPGSFFAESKPSEAGHAYITPARTQSRSASESLSRSRNRRDLGDNMQALREVADYGALKSAQKRRSASKEPEPRTPERTADLRPSVPPARRNSRSLVSPAELSDEQEEHTPPHSPLPSFSLAPRNLSRAPGAHKTPVAALPAKSAMKSPASNAAETARAREPEAARQREAARLRSQHSQLKSSIDVLERRLERLRMGTSTSR